MISFYTTVIEENGKLRLWYICRDAANVPNLAYAESSDGVTWTTIGSETIAMMQRHEAQGTITHPEYMAAITLLNYRHVCRLEEWPAPVKRSLDDWNMGPYVTIQGPNEFLYTGNLKDWNRVPDLHRITVPTLITCGQHDELTPACALRMKQHLPNATLKVFPNASHMPFYEEPHLYYPALLEFLGKHRG